MLSKYIYYIQQNITNIVNVQINACAGCTASIYI